MPVRKENVSECVKYFLNEYQQNGIEYENAVRSWVVLHGWGVDKTDIERGLIMACRNSEEVVLFDGEEDIKDLKNFLDNKQKKYLVASEELFVGCEAPHIIYVLNDDYFASHRCPLLRAVEELGIIHIISDDYYSSMTFENVRKDAEFLQCREVETKYRYFCKTCADKATTEDGGGGEEDDLEKTKRFVVCTDCRFGCDHDDHDITPIYKPFSKRKTKKCMCNRFNTCKINRKKSNFMTL